MANRAMEKEEGSHQTLMEKGMVKITRTRFACDVENVDILLEIVPKKAHSRQMVMVATAAKLAS